MSNNIKTPKSALSILFFLALLPFKLYSQVDLLYNGINGETIISSTVSFSGSTQDVAIGAVATSKSVYWIDKSGKTHNFFTAGTNTTVVDIVSKISNDSFQILILFNDGSATLAKIYNAKSGPVYGYKDFKKSDSSVYSKTFEKISGDAVYVLSTHGFYVTRDLGNTWQWDTAGLKGAIINDFTIDKSQNVYLATTGGIFKQTPTGTSWTLLANNPGFKSSISSIFFDRKDRILARTNFSVLYQSTDNGNSWIVDTIGLGNVYVNKFFDDVYGNLYALGNNNFLFKSDAGTGTWKRIDANLRTLTNQNVRISTLIGDSSLWAGTSYGLYVSNDQGITWQEHNDGIYAEQATSMAKNPNNNIFATTSLGLFRLDAAGNNWTKVYPALGYESGLMVYNDNSGKLFLLDPSINSNYSATPILTSTDNSNNWNIDTIGLSQINGSVYYIDETGAQHWANSRYGNSWKSTFWTRSNTGNWSLDTVGIPQKNYSYFSGIGSDLKGYLYVAAQISINDIVYRRPIGGGTWVPDTSGISKEGIKNFTSGGKAGIYCWNSIKLYHRSGNTWQPVPNPKSVSVPVINWASVDSNGVLFANFKGFINGNSYGVFYTKDTGLTWTYAGLNNISIKSLYSYGDTTYAITYNNWVYKLLAKPDLGGIVNDPKPVSELKIYPNPANAFANIEYNINNPGLVTFELYNELGQKISEENLGMQLTGMHISTLNLQTLQKGVYFCRFYG